MAKPPKTYSPDKAPKSATTTNRVPAPSPKLDEFGNPLPVKDDWSDPDDRDFPEDADALAGEDRGELGTPSRSLPLVQPKPEDKPVVVETVRKRIDAPPTPQSEADVKASTPFDPLVHEKSVTKVPGKLRKFL